MKHYSFNSREDAPVLETVPPPPAAHDFDFL